ncbi:MAG TPA: response regulator [Polyangiaceae bacterium]|jgi:CheY-like chemotaxis protein
MAEKPNPLQVLVVEDDDDSREVLGELIEYLGRHPVLAKDATEALARVRERTPDIGLIDVSLPGIDGCELARQLRALTGTRMRLVALTGHSDATIRKEAQDAGFDDYWVKPIASDAISTLLATTNKPASAPDNESP